MGMGARVVQREGEEMSVYEFILSFTSLMLIGISSIIYFFTKRSSKKDETFRDIEPDR
jgi:uncharacterized membrane protein AbrB (regulator of aidB expression)